MNPASEGEAMDELIEMNGAVAIPAGPAQQPSKAAVDFLMQEYELLSQHFNMWKEVGETRLATFITMTGAVFTVLIAAQGFVSSELGLVLLAAGSTFLFLLGLITYRKMLVRRSVLTLTRRKMARIRIWFLRYYPELASGMVFSENDHTRFDWGKYKIGTTPRFIVVVNCALVILPITWWLVQSYSLKAFVWVIPLDAVLAVLVWYVHIVWKQRFFLASETMATEELEKLEALKDKYGTGK